MIPFTKAHACGNDFLIVTEEAAYGHNWADLPAACARATPAWALTASSSLRGPARNPAASASTTPTAPWPRSAATAPAAWPRGWPSERNSATRRPCLKSQPTRASRVCHIDRRQANGRFTVEVTTGMGVPDFAPRTVKLAERHADRRHRSLHRQPALRHRRRHADFESQDKRGTDRRGDLRPPRFPPSDQRRVRPHRQQSRD